MAFECKTELKECNMKMLKKIKLYIHLHLHHPREPIIKIIIFFFPFCIQYHLSINLFSYFECITVFVCNHFKPAKNKTKNATAETKAKLLNLIK